MYLYQAWCVANKLVCHPTALFVLFVALLFLPLYTRQCKVSAIGTRNNSEALWCYSIATADCAAIE